MGMGAVGWWREWRRAAGRSAVLKSIRRFLFEQSHLAAYLPIMKEPLPAKLARIYADQAYSFPEEDALADPAHTLRAQRQKRRLVGDWLLRSRECVDPMAGGLLAWYVLVCAAIVAVYVTGGIALVFGEEAWAQLAEGEAAEGVELFCLAVLLGDVVVQLSAGFLLRGMVVVERARAVRRYAGWRLAVDLLLAAVLVVRLATAQFWVNVPKMLVVVKFARMFEIDALFVRRLSRSGRARALYVMSKQLLTIFLIAHSMGLLFYSIDYALVRTPLCEDDNALCWLYSSTAYSPILGYGWALRYFYSLYWGVNTVTTISYGDIASMNPIETVFELACFCFSFLAYGYVVNSIVQVMLESRKTRDDFREQLGIFTTYMDCLAVARPHQLDLREYLEEEYLGQGDRKVEVEQEMQGRLPVQLREELLKSAYSRLFDNLQQILFGSASVVRLLGLLQERRFARGEAVLRQGAPLTHLLYLHRGELRLTCARHQRTHPLTTLRARDEFVALYELVLNERAAFTVVTAETSALYVMEREELVSEVGLWTDLRENWKLLQDELRHDRNYERIFYRCYFCGADHHWYACPDRFPDFAALSLAKTIRPRPHRLAYVRLNVWKNRAELQGIVRGRVEDKVLLKIEERVRELRSIKETWRSDLEVDAHHDWTHYKPAHNLSRFREEWNARQQEQRRSLPLPAIAAPQPESPIAPPPAPLGLGALFSLGF